MTQRRIVFDLDGTLCTETHGQYARAEPLVDRVAEVRRRFAAGERIIIETARGSETGIDWLEPTTLQLARWGVPYHELHVGRKPFAHVYVCDRSRRPEEFFAGNGHPERWPDSYFARRVGNDMRRQAAFQQEAQFLRQHGIHADRGVSVCDVGCSTGEFLAAIGWIGPRFGMEINAVARAEAARSGIRFDRDILTEQSFFDLVIFRGTIQHLPHPFRYIEAAHRALKSGGHVAFLATPNAGGLVYRLFQELPVSDDPRNYWMPSDKTLSNALLNFGFEIVALEYPYLDGGYARPLHDAFAFGRRLMGIGRTDFPWPGNMVNLLARKP